MIYSPLMKARSEQTLVIPFSLDGKSGKTAQMVDGIRAAIDKRFWKPGDRLPTAAEFAKALGTGGFVPRTALRQLADEGVITLKKHAGAFVAHAYAPKPSHRIAFITSSSRESYYENVHAFALQELLERAGHELVHITLPRALEPCGADELTALQRQLARGLDFAVCFTGSREVARLLDLAGVGYIYEGGTGRDFPNAASVFNLELDSEDCGERLAAHWTAAKVKNVLVVDFEHIMPRTVLSALTKAGMTLRRLIVPHPARDAYLHDIQQAGLDAVAEFFAREKNRRRPPDAVFFYDDYLTSGGLIALAATGLRIPEEMRVATLANRGHGPVWFKPLTRLEYDPVGNARLIGDYVLGLLEKRAPDPPTLRLEFILGET